MNIQEATSDDIQELAVHHKKMFVEIFENKGQIISTAVANGIEKAYAEKLINQLPNGNCKAWVIRNHAQIVASGAISIVSYVPVPNDINHNIAYLHSMYTEKEFRGRDFAHQIIEKAIQYCKKIGINRILLNASDAGRPLYDEVGFCPSPESMRLFIKNENTAI